MLNNVMVCKVVWKSFLSSDAKCYLNDRGQCSMIGMDLILGVFECKTRVCISGARIGRAYLFGVTKLSNLLVNKLRFFNFLLYEFKLAGER